MYSRNDSRRGDGIRRDLSCRDLKLMRSTLIQLKYYPAFKCGRFHGTRRSQEDRGVVEKALKGVRIYNNDPAQIFATCLSRENSSFNRVIPLYPPSE